MVDIDHQIAMVPFPLFHGTSAVLVPSIRTHGLGGKNIVADWRILDFLHAGMALLDSHVDRSDPAIELQWNVMQKAASQVVDHFNWRHGATYLIAAEFRAVMYATSNPYSSELLGFAGWLLEHCPSACRPALDAALINYPELSQCLRVKHEPLLIRAVNVPTSCLLTETGEDATGTISKLTEALAKSERFFNGISQIGAFELHKPLSADCLQFFRIVDVTDESLSYRLEVLQ